MVWDQHRRPPSDQCPGEYCFQWIPPGGSADMSGRSYGSVREALARRDGWVDFPDGGCSCTFGVCTRLDPVAGDRDWYEPCEPALERDGLPWFYFIPSAEGLNPESAARYERESQVLWGGPQEAEPGAAADPAS